jgi:CHAD domain-containing protein
MAQARAIPDLLADGSYAEAAAKVVSVRAQELFDHAAGVLDTTDIERVHDMRVASRRLRAALEVFEPCFPGEAFERTLGGVKELADALGERRDRDVSIAELSDFAIAMAGPDRRGVGTLVDRFRAEQGEANEALAPLVDETHLVALRERLSELIAGVGA